MRAVRFDDAAKRVYFDLQQPATQGGKGATRASTATILLHARIACDGDPDTSCSRAPITGSPWREWGMPGAGCEGAAISHECVLVQTSPDPSARGSQGLGKCFPGSRRTAVIGRASAMTQAARQRKGQHRQLQRRQWRRASTTPKRSTTQVQISASYAHLRLQHPAGICRVCNSPSLFRVARVVQFHSRFRLSHVFPSFC